MRTISTRSSGLCKLDCCKASSVLVFFCSASLGPSSFEGCSYVVDPRWILPFRWPALAFERFSTLRELFELLLREPARYSKGLNAFFGW